MRWKSSVYTIAPLLAALSFFAGNAPAAENEPVSVCEVMKDLPKWHGKTVKLKGTFAIGKHSAQLLDRACSETKVKVGSATVAPTAALREPTSETARQLPPAARTRIESFWSRLDKWENERESGGPLSLEIRLVVTGVLESTSGAQQPAQVTLTDVEMLN